jgi:hypothetical protein
MVEHLTYEPDASAVAAGCSTPMIRALSGADAG